MSCDLVLTAALAMGAGAETQAAPGTAPVAHASFRRFLPHIDLDRAGRRVRLAGRVVLREGPPLELLACLKGTKEHESVVAVEGRARHIQLALIAAGLKPGRPAGFDPFRAATGATVRVTAWWRQGDRWRRIDARRWVHRIGKPGKTLDRHWVFAGSGFYKDPHSGQSYFMADGGDVISLVNFTSAILDVPFRSSDANAELGFEANTPLIPPEGTKVLLVLEPAAPATRPSSQPTRAKPAPKASR